MAHFPIRNQRAFLFNVAISNTSEDIFVLGPLQPGEELDEIFLDLFSATVAGSVQLQVMAHDSLITVPNFFSSTALLTQNRTPLIVEFSNVGQAVRHVEIPIHRAATERERYFAVFINAFSLGADLSGMCNFSVRFFPEHVNPI